MKSFRQVIALWPTVTVLGDDVGADAPTVRAWKARNRIPVEYWRVMLEAAKRRRIRLRPMDLIELAEPE